MAQTPPYRRPRSQEQKRWLRIHIMAAYNRFFPRGCPAIFYAEWEARRAQGYYTPDHRDEGRQGLLRLNETPKHPRAAQRCYACGRRFWYYPSQGFYRYCGSRCRDAAHLSALYTAYPDWTELAPVTTELRYWCYTHDTLQRPPAALASSVIRNESEALSTDLNTYYDEKTSLTTAQQDALRDRISTLLSRQLVRVNSQLAGTTKKEWSAAQVRLFLGMLDKVLPNITASMSLSKSISETIPATRDPSKMTREELETSLAAELARGASVSAPPRVIDADTLDPARATQFKPGNTSGVEHRFGPGNTASKKD